LLFNKPTDIAFQENVVYYIAVYRIIVQVKDVIVNFHIVFPAIAVEN